MHAAIHKFKFQKLSISNVAVNWSRNKQDMPFRSEGVNVLEKEQTIHLVTFEPTICTYKQTSSILQTSRLSIEHCTIPTMFRRMYSLTR